MISRHFVRFVAAAAASGIFVTLSISQAAVKWRRHHNSLCTVDKATNNFAEVLDFSMVGGAATPTAVVCPWVSGDDFEADLVTEVQVDVINNSGSNDPHPFAQLCVTFTNQNSGSCSTAHSTATLGHVTLSITDTASLNIWHNNVSAYPYVLVNLGSENSDTTSNWLQGYKVID